MRIALAAAFLAAASALGAQQPPPPSPSPAANPADTAARAVDTVTAPPPAPDTLRLHVLPEVDGRPRAGAEREVWIFEREDLLAMQGLSLGDLLVDVPGVIRLRGGDYGAPEAATAYGLAGGGIRIFWDGFEQIPLDGSVTDLAQIGLGGLDRVRVERHPGELRIDLESLRDHDPRVLSLVEAGTGDLGTNFFTGTFLHPRALGGSFGLALDRVDTNGPRREEGAMTGGWLRYHRFFAGDALALTAEARRMTSGARISDYPGEGTRLDWVVRARWRPAPGFALQAFTGLSEAGGLERAGTLPVDRERRQHGLIADAQRGPIRIEGSLRLLDGPELPSRTLDATATIERNEVGGVEGSVSSEAWGDDAATLTRVAAWTRGVAGLSAFFGRDEGERGAALYPVPPDTTPAEDAAPAQDEAPGWRLTHRTATRIGARFAWRGVDVTGARLRLETDSLALLNLPMDRGGLVLPGIERTGFEVSGYVPLAFLPDGFGLTGSLTQWDEGARYLPRRTYTAYAVFHHRYKETGNLEIWGRLGVEGRSEMEVPIPAGPGGAASASPTVQPYYRSWHALIQVRVVEIRLFVAWENFTVERDLQDFPDRVLPVFRSHYGVRWTLWN